MLEAGAERSEAAGLPIKETYPSDSLHSEYCRARQRDPLQPASCGATAHWHAGAADRHDMTTAELALRKAACSALQRIPFHKPCPATLPTHWHSFWKPPGLRSPPAALLRRPPLLRAALLEARRFLAAGSSPCGRGTGQGDTGGWCN